MTGDLDRRNDNVDLIEAFRVRDRRGAWAQRRQCSLNGFRWAHSKQHPRVLPGPHAMEKSFKTQDYRCRPCILVEGPAWGDAKFYGQWLLGAGKANELLQDATNNDAEFRTAIETLEMGQCLDFGIMATVFLSLFADKQFQ